MPGKPKIFIREAIPGAFADCMQEVSRLIAAHDEQTTIESDDLIQIRGESGKPYIVTGGLYSEKEQRFGFYFFYGDYDVGDGVDEGGTIEWCYYLSKEEIAGIASRTISQLNMWGVSSTIAADGGASRMAIVRGVTVLPRKKPPCPATSSERC